MNIHTVRQGDNLWKIAQQHHKNINQIAVANGLHNPHALVVGQALVIPTTLTTYVVQPGDTLISIANQHGVTIRGLAEENNIQDPSRIFVGQVLRIPQITHTITSGETLRQIAQNYGTTIDAIVQANQITNPDQLKVGQTLRIPERTRPVIDVNAYVTGTGASSVQEVKELGKYFTFLSPFSHSIREDGTISPMNEEALIAAAKENHVAPLLVLTNFSQQKFNSELAATILRHPTLQETTITNILRILREKGYRGINIDFEYVFPEDRENYNAFLRRVVARLHPEGYIVSTAVAPKVSANQQGLLYEAHDYHAHGEIVDFVIIMTYEWGWAGGQPMAIAPVNEIRRVLDFAVTQIPRNKILMGLPLYGRDWIIPWIQGTIARTVSPQEAVQIAAKHEANIKYDEAFQAPFFRYTDDSGQRHEVWFEDARSQQAKMNLAKEFRLRGLSYWVLGNPFPQNWLVQGWNFRVRKHL